MRKSQIVRLVRHARDEQESVVEQLADVTVAEVTPIRHRAEGRLEVLESLLAAYDTEPGDPTALERLAGFREGEHVPPTENGAEAAVED